MQVYLLTVGSNCSYFSEWKTCFIWCRKLTEFQTWIFSKIESAPGLTAVWPSFPPPSLDWGILKTISIVSPKFVSSYSQRKWRANCPYKIIVVVFWDCGEVSGKTLRLISAFWRWWHVGGLLSFQNRFIQTKNPWLNAWVVVTQWSFQIMNYRNNGSKELSFSAQRSGSWRPKFNSLF